MGSITDCIALWKVKESIVEEAHKAIVNASSVSLESTADLQKIHFESLRAKALLEAASIIDEEMSKLCRESIGANHDPLTESEAAP